MLKNGKYRLAIGSNTNAQESHFQAEDLSGMGSAVLQGVDLLLLRNRVLRLRSFHIWAVPSYIGVNLLMLRNGLFRATNVRYGHCHPAMAMNRNRVFKLRFVYIWAVPT